MRYNRANNWDVHRPEKHLEEPMRYVPSEIGDSRLYDEHLGW
jgi:hypothetical protein